jgi:hypothetical protein
MSIRSAHIIGDLCCQVQVLFGVHLHHIRTDVTECHLCGPRFTSSSPSEAKPKCDSADFLHDFLGLLPVRFGVNLRGHGGRMSQNDPRRLDIISRPDFGRRGMTKLVG